MLLYIIIIMGKLKTCYYLPVAKIPTAENISKLMNHIPTYQDDSFA